MTRVGKPVRIRFAALIAAALVAALGTPGWAQRISPDVTKTKQSESLRAVFKDVSAQANKSTVAIRASEKGTSHVVAMGTIVSEDGFILTKASEVLSQPEVTVSIVGNTGSAVRNYPAKIVGYSEAQDLAMLKIDATGLIPVIFADTRPGVPDTNDLAPPGARGVAPAAGAGGAAGGRRGGRGRGANVPVVMPAVITPPAPPKDAIEVDVGEWVASANIGASMGKSETEDEPFAVGVVSVARRRIPGRNAFLGVSLGDAETATGGAGGGSAGGGAKILQVIPGSAAESAGIKVDDIITAVNGIPTPNRTELITTVQKYRPGDVVTLSITRGDTSLSLKANLGTNDILEGPEQTAMSRLLGGAVSQRSSDFPAVFQHDTVIRPENCGGPIVDLQGHVIGINIARAGRTETYALPADVIIPLIEPMKSGKLAPVNANAPGPSTKPGQKATTIPALGE